jgi:phosphoglycerate dehydrogenase-like enzyme
VKELTAKKIIYFDQVFGDFKNILLEHKPEGFDLLFWDEMNNEEKEELLPIADYLLVATKKIDDSIISKAKKAKLIQKTGIGVDNIDIESTKVNGIPVSNTPGVAELTILLILSLYRNLPYVNRETKAGKWLMWEVRPTSFELEGKIHGFIGFGMIGREAAKRSKAFGTNIVYYDEFRASTEHEEALGATYLSLEEVLQKSDVISLHLPLLPDTKGLIGERELSMMKESAILINVSRGGIVKEDALYGALKEGVIAGAGVDVWESEPTDPANPLLTLENVIASPHIGAGTRDTLNRVLKIAFDNIVKVDNGENPDYVVNNTVYLSK